MIKRLVIIFWLVACMPVGIWAHVFLDHADPKVGSTVSGSGKVVKIWFTQELEPAFSTLEVQDVQGTAVDKKDAHLDDRNKSLFLVSLPQLPAASSAANGGFLPPA